MTEDNRSSEKDRREFLKDMAICGGALAMGSYSSVLRAAPPPDWKTLIGIQLTVVRDEWMKSPEGTLAKLAEIGYKTIGPVGFSGIDPKEYRAMLDRNGLIAAQIDQGFTTGPDMERDLAACQTLGLKFAEPGGVGAAGGAAPARGAAGGGAPAGGPARAGGAGGRGAAPPQTLELAKRTAEDYNRYGQIAKKFGIMVTYHNHIEHFDILPGTQTTFFDVFMSETDPATVGMELDLGYTALGGRDVPAIIKQYAGRFPTWDVRDYWGLRNSQANPALTATQRRVFGYSVPVGLGEVDFKTIFAGAETSGLKYFFVVQDNSVTWGDSLAAARISFQNLATKVFA